VLLGSRGSRSRCLVVWTAASTCLGLVGAGARAGAAHLPLTASALRTTPLDAALTDLAALTLLACAAWMWVVTTAVVIEALRGTDRPEAAPRGVPTGVRRLVLAACGVALAGGLVSPSQAAAPSTVSPPHHPPRPLLAGLPLPDRAVATSSSRPRTVLVRSGDTLWSIAADDLPEDSAAERITERWRAIYATNSALIGPDPDVIVPGQRLRLPGKDPS
jgi:nucleoid-associated protein YgaU